MATLLITALPAWAAETVGQIIGTVLDDQGLPVPGSVVNTTSAALQGARSADTDGEGRFQFVALPPGEYRVTVAKPGFNDYAGLISVGAGRNSILNVSLKAAVAQAEMVVEDDAPTIDVTSARSGLSLSQEQLRDIPSAGRDYQSATTMAAGVVDNGTGNNNVRGSLSYGNQYYLDGVNITDPITNTFSMNMNYDAIAEVQVITGGMDAEYGRSMGGAVNVVTRSGGNEFEGDFQLLYSSTATRVYKKLPEEEGVPVPERASESAAVNLGGPIVKDRLWFFTSVQVNYSLYTPAMTKEVRDEFPAEFTSQDGGSTVYDIPTQKWTSVYWFGKLTYSPNPNHRIIAHAQGDPTNIDNSTASIYTLSNDEVWWRQGGWLSSVQHVWTPAASVIVDTQLSYSTSYINTQPMQWKDCKSYDADGACEDDFAAEYGAWQSSSGYSYGPFPYASYSSRQRYSLVSSITKFFELWGRHQVKAGVQGDLLRTSSINPGLEDGIPYYEPGAGGVGDLAGYQPSFLLRYDTNLEAEQGGGIASVYLQDAWQPIDRLTLRPGARLDYSSFSNNVGEEVFSALTVAPRVGAAYDLTGDGRTSTHAFYGRFYDSGFLEIPDILSRGLSGYGYYNWDAEAEDWETEPNLSVASTFLVHEDLVPPHSDEFDLGFSRDFGNGWAGDLTWTYEVSRNLFEDDEVNLIWNADGTEIIGSRDGTGETYYRLRTPDEAFTKYTSLEFAVNRDYGDGWTLFSSYTWSRAWGRTRDDISQGLASASFDIGPQQEFEEGLMPYDTPHSVKVAGSYRDPDTIAIGDKSALGWLFGWNYMLSSGTPYRPVYYQPTYQDWINYKEPLNGDYRLPAYSRLDAKVGVSFQRGQTNWDVTAECFNVLNDRTVTSVWTLADNPDGTPQTDEDGNIRLGQPDGRQSPRYFQLGLRGEF
jgi:outer membrane receptor for ferrienterochelin and colicin